MNPDDDPDASASGQVPQQRMRKIRVTVDLAGDAHCRLQQWCIDAGRDLDHRSVKQAVVIRLLLERLYSDPELERHVMDSLRKQIR
jgi:hypothetical protein